MKILLLLGSLVIVFCFQAPAQSYLRVLPGLRVYPDAPNALYYHTNNLAINHLAKRAQRVAAINTLSEWKNYQGEIRKKLDDVIGPFPEKTLLKPKITGRIKKDFFTLEHVIFESRPNYLVTASLYLPNKAGSNGKLPAIVYCSGHTPLGYRGKPYQQVILNLVKKGFVVLAFDPVGQGERIQYNNPKAGEPVIGSSTKEHSYPGAQLLVTGTSLVQYMVWDGIRAVDYLLTRKEVDANRIGMTGRSGGGTQSAQIAAFDDRIYALAPENYLTNYTRLLQTQGPQDAEQFYKGEIASGLDQPDMLLVRAPKPALMITTTNDMFNVQGTLETENEVAKAYAAYGKTENFSRIEDLAGHASTLKNREAMYAFFQLHLRNPGSPKDEEVQHLSREELKVTKSGQLKTSLGGETPFSLNRKTAEQLAASLGQSRKNNPKHTENIIAAAKRISGFEAPDKKPQPFYLGRIKGKEYSLDKYLLKSEGDYPIPFLLLTPENANGKAVIYLDDAGKVVVSRDSLQLTQLVGEGYTVLVPDLIGTGEMGPVNFHNNSTFEGVTYNAWFSTVLLNRSIVGIRTGDILRLVSFLKQKLNTDAVIGVAVGNMSAELLHAAAFEASISQIALIDPMISYLPIVLNRIYDPKAVYHVVPGALTNYDLPDLAASLAPRKLLMLPAKTTSTDKADASLISENMATIKKAFAQKNTQNLLIKEDGATSGNSAGHILEWLRADLVR